MMIADINGLCLQKIYVNFLISTLKSNEKGGVGVIYQLYNFILNTAITQKTSHQLILTNMHTENNMSVSC